MSFKASVIKVAIKWTPIKPILWVANLVLKDIAELKDFSFDLAARKIYVQVQLLGESETIDVWLEDFAVISDEASYRFIVQQARSNRIWLTNILALIAGKSWKIPELPQYAAEIALVAELLNANIPEQEE